jgi:hypothetical protein
MTYEVIIHESSCSSISRGIYQNYKKNKAQNFIKINKKKKPIFSKHQKATIQIKKIKIY